MKNILALTILLTFALGNAFGSESTNPGPNECAQKCHEKYDPLIKKAQDALAIDAIQQKAFLDEIAALDRKANEENTRHANVGTVLKTALVAALAAALKITPPGDLAAAAIAQAAYLAGTLSETSTHNANVAALQDQQKSLGSRIAIFNIKYKSDKDELTNQQKALDDCLKACP